MPAACSSCGAISARLFDYGLEAIEPGEENRELVAGEPARMRVLGKLREQTAREDLEARVARRVAERVVDVFELVDVEIQDRDVLLRAPRARDALLQQVLELHPVRDFRERVGTREIADPLLDAFSLVDVVCRVHLALDLVALVMHAPDGVGDAHRRAVRPRHRALARPRRGAIRSPPVARDDQLIRELTDELGVRTAEELARRGVRALDPTVHVRDQQRLAHAREQAIEVVSGNRARPKTNAHRVDGVGELAKLARPGIGGRVVVAAGCVVQRGDHDAQPPDETIRECGDEAETREARESHRGVEPQAQRAIGQSAAVMGREQERRHQQQPRRDGGHRD